MTSSILNLNELKAKLKLIERNSIVCLGPGCMFCDESEINGLNLHPKTWESKMATKCLSLIEEFENCDHEKSIKFPSLEDAFSIKNLPPKYHPSASN